MPPPGRPKGKDAPPGGSKRAQHARRGGRMPPPGRPKGKDAPPGGQQACAAWKHYYFGGMRMAPSRRMVSPFSMSFVTML